MQELLRGPRRGLRTEQECESTAAVDTSFNSVESGTAVQTTPTMSELASMEERLIHMERENARLKSHLEASTNNYDKSKLDMKMPFVIMMKKCAFIQDCQVGKFCLFC